MDPFSPIRRAKSYPRCGRLIVLEEGTRADHLSPLDLTRFFSIDFPAMPDQIELVREAQYNSLMNLVAPDGVHMYKGTSLMEIPFEFKLHFLDKEYCPDGALSILTTAARLHALVVPVGDSKLLITVDNTANLRADGTSNSGDPPRKTDADKKNNAGKPANTTQGAQPADTKDPTIHTESTAAIDPPVTCRLELIYTTPDGPGIICNGFVKKVGVTFMQPWLRGPNGSFNLPSAAKFSFVFAHVPGWGNWLSNSRTGQGALSQQAQAYADIIQTNLFNTRTLQTTSQYRGFLTSTKS
jgi:hypothetical protein